MYQPKSLQGFDQNSGIYDEIRTIAYICKFSIIPIYTNISLLIGNLI